MSRALKITLIVLGILVLLGGACVGGIVLWFRGNLPAIESVGNEATAQGQQFGAGRAGPECVAEALRRGDACDGVVCEAGASIFLRSCLGAATVTPELCHGVPPIDSLLDSVRWRLSACEQAGAADVQRCTRIVDAVQKHCHEAAPPEGG